MPQVTVAHPFTQHLENLGIRHKLIRIATPWHNGKEERSHRTDEEEFYRLFRLRTVPEARRRLANCNKRYNTDRPMAAWAGKLPCTCSPNTNNHSPKVLPMFGKPTLINSLPIRGYALTEAKSYRTMCNTFLVTLRGTCGIACTD